MKYARVRRAHNLHAMAKKSNAVWKLMPMDEIGVNHAEYFCTPHIMDRLNFLLQIYTVRHATYSLHMPKEFILFIFPRNHTFLQELLNVWL